MKLFQGLAILMVWLIGLPLTISAAFGAAWSGTGGIDSGDAPSSAASFGAVVIVAIGIALMVGASVALSRLDDPDAERPQRKPETDPWDKNTW